MCTVRLTVSQAVVKFLASQHSERDGVSQRLIPGMWAIFGHGNVSGLGQALEELGDEVDLPTYRPQNEMLDEVLETGYEGTELGDLGYIPTDPARLREGLEQRNLTMLGAYEGVNLREPEAIKESRRRILTIARDTESLDREVCMVFLSGDAEVEVDGKRWTIAGRRGVFAGLLHAVYVPPGHRYLVTAKGALEVAVGSAPAKGKLEPRLIAPDDVKVEIRGGHNVTRQISHILDPGDAEKLLCVEVYTPSGNWSSYPPHKHDVHNMIAITSTSWRATRPRGTPRTTRSSPGCADAGKASRAGSSSR